ncbi:MAG: tRNA (adenosine(37)-N6)-threonylcarbamoyltransferase complex dimerization subunit type 1 TsaB [Verrucomicrobiia bacterium]|jgi:tRNA threonylcarbamoyladenosine biosynthesis protein TsaB
MITLGIDTSTARGSVAVLHNDQPLAEELFCRGDGKEAPAQHLFGAIDELLSSQKLAPRDIGLITVGIGPGSFTGIRVGIAAAKGLAMPWALPIKAINSFDALAVAALAQMPRDCRQICVFCDARRDEIYSAIYDKSGRRVRDCKISALEEIADEIHYPMWFISSEIERFNDALKETFGGFASICKAPLYPSAAALGWLGIRKSQEEGNRGDAQLEPIYLRVPDYKKL